MPCATYSRSNRRGSSSASHSGHLPLFTPGGTRGAPDLVQLGTPRDGALRFRIDTQALRSMRPIGWLECRQAVEPAPASRCCAGASRRAGHRPRQLSDPATKRSSSLNASGSASAAFNSESARMSSIASGEPRLRQTGQRLGAFDRGLPFAAGATHPTTGAARTVADAVEPIDVVRCSRHTPRRGRGFFEADRDHATPCDDVRPHGHATVGQVRPPPSGNAQGRPPAAHRPGSATPTEPAITSSSGSADTWRCASRSSELLAPSGEANAKHVGDLAQRRSLNTGVRARPGPPQDVTVDGGMVEACRQAHPKMHASRSVGRRPGWTASTFD